MSRIEAIKPTDAVSPASHRNDSRRAATFAAAPPALPPSPAPSRPVRTVDPIGRENVQQEVISWQEACEWIFPGEKPAYDRMWRLVRNGARIRGVPEPIKLAAWPTPGGIKFRETDVHAFIARFQEAWRAAHDAAPETRTPVSALFPGRSASRKTGLLGSSSLRRCADHEIGTYPTDDKPPARRGGDLRLVGGSAGVKEDLGRHVDVTA